MPIPLGSDSAIPGALETVSQLACILLVSVPGQSWGSAMANSPQLPGRTLNSALGGNGLSYS